MIELREIAKERKIKGISTLKKKELIETLEKYDQENYKEVKSKEETHGEHQGRESIIRRNSLKISRAWTVDRKHMEFWKCYAGWLWIYSL